MIQIAIVEDNPIDRKTLRQMTEQYFVLQQERVNFHEFDDGSAIIEQYPSDLDLILMDIDMPKLNGLDASRKIREIDPHVDLILVTNLIQCALDGYSVEAIDFVVKPVTAASLERALSRILRRVRQRQGSHIEVLCQKNKCVLNANQILYVETQRHNVLIHKKENDLVASESMASIEKKLQDQPFYRCHTSFLVNLKEIEQIGLTDLIVAHVTIPISKHRRKGLLDKMAVYVGENC